jgi:integrase
LATLHDKDIKAITRNEVLGVIDDLRKESGARAADCARISLSTFFTWALDHKDQYVNSNPAAGIKACAESSSRERVLAEAELREVWRACLDDDYGRIVKLLMLTGQRKTEIGDLNWSEVNEAQRQIELLGARTKNKRPHVVPLSKHAWAALPKKRKDRDQVFGRRAHGFSGWSKSKRELDERIAAARNTAGLKTPMPPWTIHDLRRTFVTHVLDRKLALPHVVEACVNHISGHKAGVAGVYNKANYADEKRAAMDEWGKHVHRIVKQVMAP